MYRRNKAIHLYEGTPESLVHVFGDIKPVYSLKKPSLSPYETLEGAAMSARPRPKWLAICDVEMTWTLIREHEGPYFIRAP